MANMQLPQGEFVDELSEQASASLVLAYIGILRRRLWIILPVVIICGTLGLFKAVRARDIFRADTQLLVEKQASTLDFRQAGQDTRWDPNFHSTQLQLIKGRVVMDIALRDERIHEFLTAGSSSGAASSVFREMKLTVEALLGISPGPPEETWKELADKVQAVHIEDTDIFAITVRCTSAAISARIANKVSRAFQTYHRERHVKNLGAEYEMLRIEKDRAEQSLLESESGIQEFLKHASLVTPSAAQADHPAIKALKRLNDELTEVNLERIELSSEISVMKQAVDAAYEMNEKGLERRLFSIPTVESNQKLGATRRDLSEAEKDLAMLRDTYGARHPRLKSAELAVGVLRDQFTETLQEIALQQANRLQQLQQQERDLRGELDKQNAQALELANEQFDYARLKSSLDRNTRVLDTLNEKMREADVGAGLAQIRVDIIETAEFPARAENSAKLLTVILALCFGIFAGCGLAFLFENIDDTIKTPEDLADRLDVPLLGFIPAMAPDETVEGQDPEQATGFKEAVRIKFKRMRDRFPRTMSDDELIPHVEDVPEALDEDRHRRGTFVVREPMSTIAEAYRSVRASLLYSMPADEIRMIAVTSARPREGKTTTSCNLSLSLAQTGKRVLLIDADLHRPMIKRTFRIQSEHGLTSALVGEKEWKTCLNTPVIGDKTIDNFSILTAGPPSPSPSELLGSKRMTEILDEVKAEYDIVIIDTPPALFVSDASVLGVMCDGVILVVKSGDSTRSLLTRAFERLISVRAHIIGSILNGVVISRVGRYYSAYYHVGYSRYAKDYGKTYYDGEDQEEDIPEPLTADPIAEKDLEQEAPKDAADATRTGGDAKTSKFASIRRKSRGDMEPADDDDERLDRLQQDLNAEKVLRDRASMKAQQMEEQLRKRIQQLEERAEETTQEASAPESELTSTEPPGKEPDASRVDEIDATRAEATRLKSVADEFERKSRETEAEASRNEKALKNQLSATQQKLQDADAAKIQREQQLAARVEQLEAELSAVATAGPAASAGMALKDSDIALQQAKTYMESGAYDEARAILQESVQAKPDQAEAWELTIELLSLSNKQTALSECAAQLGSMGSSKESLQATALGHLAMIQGNYDAARKHFQQAHAQDRECAFVLESLTKVDVQQDRIRDAREHSRLLLKLDPENPFGHYVTAFLHIIDGNSDAAEVSLRKSIGLKKSAEALHDLAWILNSRAAYEEAEIHAQAAVEITEFNPTMWDTLGQILMNRERLTEAEGAFNHSLSLKSDNVDTLLNLTEIHARLGNRPRALELDAVLSDMQNELSPAARDRLGHIRDLVAQG